MTEDTQTDPLRDHPPISQNLIRNPISLIGIALSGVAFANIVLLVLLDLLAAHPSPYVGILAYMVAPGILVFGLILIPIGMMVERRRRLRAVGVPFHFARLDLNNPAQRSTVAFVLSFVVIFALISAVGSYQAYEFTDSVDFCGQLCHTVMRPEFTAYEHSPHARVACVDCHVGSGASWYVKSKLSGIRQVYYTALGTYPRPIPTPVANLRPAQQTCEQCHWPRKFWGAQLKTFVHYGDDEQNTPRVIRMLIKTGGGAPSLGQAGGGIHWHMNIANKVTYFASDEQRQVIPWVRIENESGKVTEYTVKDNPPTQAQIDKAEKRRMDCIDCHNRPTHIYVAPDVSVDQSMAGRTIDASLPFIKQQSVEALTADYKTTDEAKQAIATKIQKFYQEKYPQIASAKADSCGGPTGRGAGPRQRRTVPLGCVSTLPSSPPSPFISRTWDDSYMPPENTKQRARVSPPDAREPVLPTQSQEDTDVGWVQPPAPDDDERLYREAPPHWGSGWKAQRGQVRRRDRRSSPARR